MKYYLLPLLLLLTPSYGLAQSTTVVQGSILDAQTNEPISYAHIGIPAEHIGTASNQDGSFKLPLAEQYKDDSLQVSAIGYKTKRYALESILDSTSVTLKLQPKTYQMTSITVTDREPETEWIGKKIRPILSASYGMIIPNSNIGAAYAFNIKWDGPLPLKILHARMFLKENKNDMLKMRCRIAAIDSTTHTPGDDIVEKSIITTMKDDKGWITCDFDEHDIYINRRQFFLVFEWLPSEGQTYMPMFAIGPFFDSEVYDRAHAMGKWGKHPNDLIYSLKVEY